MDKFSIYQHRVEKALKAYEKTCALRDTVSKGLHETIMREAAPFIKGHFTLAVIGKMSSGKSTFINALLGNHSLLPTAYEQTTCTLTEIEYGEQIQIQIIYGDGTKKTFSDPKELLQTAAIPIKYQSLPVNFINKLILADKSENDIVKGKEKLDQLQGEEIDINLLRDYIRSHSKKNSIPTRVMIKYPLPDAYRGWKIIDTPGVSALGGLEKETRDFLNGKNEFGYNNVDAIVFVNSGRNPIQDSEFKNFVDQTFLNISPEAKRRIFMVVTHAADNQFMNNRENYLDTAKRIFVGGYKIRPERLICVDSICNLLIQYVKNSGVRITSLKKNDIPLGWDAKTWSLCIDARNYFRDELYEEDKEVNNESVIKKCENTSGFGNLRSQLDTFITTEKSLAFSRLMDNINKDVTSILNDIRQKKNILEANIGNQSLDVLKAKMLEEHKKLEDADASYKEILDKVSKIYTKKMLEYEFKKFKDKMKLLRKESSIYNIQLEAENIMDEVENKKSEILDNLTDTLAQLWDKSCSDSEIVLPQIDFETIAKNAEKNNTTTKGGEENGYHKILVKQKTIIGGIKRLFGSLFGNSSWGYDEVDDYSRPIYSKKETHTDHVKAAHEFANKVYDTFSTSITSFVDELYEYIINVGKRSQVEAEKQIKLQKDSYSELVKRNQTLENQHKTIDTFDAKIKSLQTILTELNELNHD